MKEEKLLPMAAEPQARPASVKTRQGVAGILALCLFTLFFPVPRLLSDWTHSIIHRPASPSAPQCLQPTPLLPTPGDTALDRMYAYLSTEAFRNASVIRLSGAVRIPTESYDDMGPIGEDKRWDTMYDFAGYLETTFPRTHERLKVERVNTHGLVYTWEGSDKGLKPTLLMAHQDVVPVPDATEDAWTHPPFEGAYDGKYVWGRGASDCKNQLIAIMETVELLLDAGFEPKRSIVLSFGFDEEISGREGAGHLAPFLLGRYGEDGIAAIVDEGATFEKVWGTTFAKPGVAEKGYTDVHITVRMPGGHSSIPSDHTSIGVLSELITEIEAQPYKTHLQDNNPYLAQLQCGAEHSPDFPHKLKKLLHHRSSSSRTCKAKPDRLAQEAAKQGPGVRYLMQTSQAVDVIQGGVKVNALPERVTATVNHRINVGEETKLVWEKLTALAQPIAEKYNLTLNAFNGKKEAPLSISLHPSDTTLDVAPVTPTDTTSISPYYILAGTTRALYGSNMVVAPGIMTGNTDTRYYWDLTRHIFRFGPGYDVDDEAGLGNIHTVDERQSVVGHVNAVKWFVLWVRNMDEAGME